MTASESVQRWFDGLWNAGIESTIDELAAPDMVAHGLSEQPVRGREEFHAFYRAFRSAFPTVNVTIQQLLEDGPNVTCRMQVEVVPADGRGPFRFEGTTVTRWENGRMVEGWNYFDFLGLLTQMGAVQPNAMAMALHAVASPPV
jgi:limonene-1,2-epoxide hydrolase